ncbi:unnamed protein product [Phytophthora lilii]|uniref:Unnamed protein product n=1 Tax=Phytophthora lilii TaxID=2077276 RepID=A0A9W6TJJ4_9STRA|nr:unnamed protein product [Phytophthora lilii]
MLSTQEERELVASLDFSADEMQLLELLYQTHVGKVPCKATSLEPSYAPAWIGFGNSFAAQDESDQAMSSYRTASSLFPGSHLPPLYIGMEYLRTNNLVQAQEFIRQASVICPTDPLVYNELGSVYYKQKDYPQAIEMFTKTLKLCKGLPEALAYSPGDTLAGSMITVAFEESLSGGPGSFPEFAEPPPKHGPKTSGLTPMSAALTARRFTNVDDNTGLSRRLDQSYSSIEHSRQSLACSSLDFSDDSSMMNVDED